MPENVPENARIPRLQQLLRLFRLPQTAGFVWFSAVAVALLVLLVWKLPTDPDLFWHIRAGNDILAHGLPHIDWYSHTLPSFPWVDHEWALEVPTALLARLGGLRLVTIAYALLTATALSAGLKWALPRKVEWPWVLVSGIVVALLSSAFLGSRPQMMTYLLLLLLIGLLRRVRENTRYAWLLPLLLLVWANLHGSFLLGLAVTLTWIGAEVSLRILPRLRAGTPLSYKALGVLTTAGVLAVAATFANPYLQGVWVEALRTLRDSDLHKNIVEWFSPDVRSQHGFLLFGTTLAWIAAIAVRRAEVRLPTLAITLMLWLAGLMAIRNMPLFYLLAIPQITLVVREQLPELLQALRLWPALVGVSVAALVLISMLVPARQLWNVNRSDEAYASAGYPVGAATYLAQHTELGPSYPYNSYGWGGYLLLHVPWFKTFIDGRMPSWKQGSVKIIDDYFVLDRLESGWQAKLEHYHVDLIVVAPDHKLVGALAHDKRFKEIFRDKQAVILKRT